MTRSNWDAPIVLRAGTEVREKHVFVAGRLPREKARTFTGSDHVDISLGASSWLHKSLQLWEG